MSVYFALPLRVCLCLGACIMPATAAWPGSALAQSGPSEKEAFEAAKSLGTVEAWGAFLSNYPTGFRTDLARAYVKKLSETTPSPAPSQGAAPSVSANDDLPAAAGSWGGVLRDGPGRNYRQIGSLKEGEPVTLMGRTDVLVTRSGKTGYQWGGILCSTGAERPDLYKTCP